jgi:hypothetical protein
MPINQNSALIMDFARTINDNNGKISHSIFDCGFSVKNCEELFFCHFGQSVGKPRLYHDFARIHKNI